MTIGYMIDTGIAACFTVTVDTIGGSMDQFLSSNEWQWRLLRTIVQGLIGVLIANLDLIVGMASVDQSLRGVIVAFVMAILSPIMAELGSASDE
jgi:hypothetical protein